MRGVIEAIEHQLQTQSQHTAVISDDGCVRYLDLGCNARCLSSALTTRGLGPDRVVALVADRSVATVTTMLATLRAGGAYVPIDPRLPRERIAIILRETSPVAILCAREHRAAIPIMHERVLELEAATASGTHDLASTPPDALAYIIYTSGSTGTPKGVMIPRRGFNNQVRWMQDRFPLGPSDRVLQLASLMFDFSVLEVFWPLSAGATIVLPRPGGELEPAYLARLMRDTATTVVHFVPSLLRVFLEARHDPLPAVRWLFSGGEALAVADARRARALFPNAQLVNQYGPTETTINATSWVVDPAAGGEQVPIGTAVGGTSLAVVDPTQAAITRVADGTTGELLVGGVQLARGYLGRPAETALRFVPDPFSTIPGQRLYRTGDRVTVLPDGALAFVGRVDHQVKLRGFRVELGEIDAVLAGHPSVLEASCVVRGDRLVGYVRWRDQPLERALEAHARAHLPAYMIPSALVAIDAWPLTPTGKLDRRALPEPANVALPVEPLSTLEHQIAEIWSELLEVPIGSAAADFLQLGGSSLTAMRATSRLADRIGVELSVAMLLRHPRLADYAQRVTGARANTDRGIPMVPRDRRLPLSPVQEGLWFLEQIDPGVYSELTAIRVRGPLDVARLARCVAATVDRHEVLRSVVVARDGVPEIELRDRGAELEVVPATDVAGLAELVRREALRPFELARGPLVRFLCAPLSPTEHVVLCHIHHLISDGVSQAILLDELAEHYTADASGRLPALRVLGPQYVDYAAWQHAQLSEPRRDALLAHWRQALAGAPPVLELPSDLPRPTSPSHRGARHTFAIPAPLAHDVQRLGRHHGATSFMTLLGLFQALLARYTGQDDLVVGTPVVTRDREELAPLVGLFVNTVPIRLELPPGATVGELVLRVRGAVTDALAHRDLPFPDLVAGLAPTRDPSRHPIVQILFVLEATLHDRTAGDVTLSAAELDTGVAKFELSLLLREQPDGSFGGVIEYATDRFEPATIVQLARHYVTLLEAACREPDAPIARLALLDHDERAALVRAPIAGGPRRSVVAQIAEQMAQRDALAIVSDSGSLTYAELDRRSRKLAGALVARGLGPDRLVAIVSERSAEAVIAMVAILRAGGAYVPIDPRLPRERIDRILHEAAPVAVLAPRVLGLENGLALDDEATWGCGPLAADHEPPPDCLAYVIYTSGSTGVPKGVMVTRRGFAAQLGWMQDEYALAPRDRVLQLASLMFDFSVIELFWPLMVGAQVVLPRPGGELEPAYLTALARTRGVTVVHFVPSLLRVLVEDATPASWDGIRLLFSGGEALAPDLVARCAAVFPAAELHNQYGPTETTINATACQIVGQPATVPIGRPVADTSLHVVDAQLSPVPRGAVGELAIGGIQLARGYLGRPAETASRFVPSPFVRGERLYRTGDLVRERSDGMLEYLGRADHQVKVRGFRVELGELGPPSPRIPGSSGPCASCVTRGSSRTSSGEPRRSRPRRSIACSAIGCPTT
ncbi:MAG: amino acid adenylation domain-containing protein [Kofleriaceae bacterium]